MGHTKSNQYFINSGKKKEGYQGKGEMKIIKNIYLTLVCIFILNHEHIYVGGAVMHM